MTETSRLGRSPRLLAKELTKAAARDGFALLRDVDLTRDEFGTFVHSIGELSSHRFGSGEAGLLELDASPRPDRIVTGRSALPLHTDGTLVGASPKFIVLYCYAVDQMPGSGCTEICLQSELLGERTPPEFKELVAGEWEYFVTDTSHFPDVANRWLSIPTTMTAADESVRLNIALPFDAADKTTGWQVRLPGLTDDDSRPVLSRLDRYLRQSPSYYAHEWTQGDLLVLDNELVLHGRTRIEPNSVRHLLRGQISG
ncbi:TauD/TfdA family dioxygenase [Nocardia sp. NPDC058640]|uniref:TauD/TfdA family dioxygenase n=1 Tax=Nocardia sp. NPDC058640 TaxID=3346571 RepID=UPI0036461D46